MLDADASTIGAQFETALGEINDAITRAFEGECRCELGAAQPDPHPSSWDGPGLILALGDNPGAAILMPESGGYLPAWYATPDEGQQQRLATLAWELAELVFPDTFLDPPSAARVDHLGRAVQRSSGEPGSAAASPLTLLSFQVERGGTSGAAYIVWPLAQAAQLLAPSPGAAGELPTAAANPMDGSGTPATSSSNASGSPSATTLDPGSRPIRSGGPLFQGEFEDGLHLLPKYSRSLLKIKLPVSVTLGTTKQPVSRIVELGQGSIIQFDKSCDETLTLEVNNRPVAEGEVVKVGDKFGLRLTSVILPGERFFKVSARGLS